MTDIVDSESNFIHCYLANAPLANKVASLSKKYVQLSFFKNLPCRYVMDCILRYQKKADGVPTRKMLEVMLSQLVKIPDHLADAVDYVRSIEKIDVTDWHEQECEKWIKQNAVLESIGTSIELIQKKELSSIIELVTNAVNIQFDNSIGMNYKNDWQKRHKHYTSADNLIDCGFQWINKISRGGLPRKTLTCFMSTKTGGFKSGTMCHMTAEMYKAGLNVLYVTMEMTEEQIGERIDANLFDLDIDVLKDLSSIEFESFVNATATKGSITIKEFEAGDCNVSQIEVVIKELATQGIFIDAVCVDYLNLMSSTRMPAKEAGGNSYAYVKSMAEELRNLTKKYNFAGITATQSGKSGIHAGKDVGIESTSESMGLPATLDLYIAIITNDELDRANKILYKQLKNRRRNIGQDTFIAILVNKARMRLCETGNMPKLKI